MVSIKIIKYCGFMYIMTRANDLVHVTQVIERAEVIVML